jgi:hypothetical protein
LDWSIYLIGIGVIGCVKKLRKKCWYLIAGLGVLILFVYIPWKNNSCNNWEKGINENLDNSEKFCKISKPEVC